MTDDFCWTELERVTRTMESGGKTCQRHFVRARCVCGTVRLMRAWALTPRRRLPHWSLMAGAKPSTVSVTGRVTSRMVRSPVMRSSPAGPEGASTAVDRNVTAG